MLCYHCSTNCLTLLAILPWYEPSAISLTRYGIFRVGALHLRRDKGNLGEEFTAAVLIVYQGSFSSVELGSVSLCVSNAYVEHELLF